MPTVVRKLRAPLLQRVSRTVEITATAHTNLVAASEAEAVKSPTPAQTRVSAGLRRRAKMQLLLAADHLRKAAAAIPE